MASALVTINTKYSWNCYSVNFYVVSNICVCECVCVWYAKSVCSMWSYLRLSLLNYWRITFEENTFGIQYWSGSNHNSTHTFFVFHSFFFTLQSLSTISSFPVLVSFLFWFQRESKKTKEEKNICIVKFEHVKWI